MELSRAKMLAVDLIRYYAPTWDFKFDRAVTRLGYTSFKSKTITLAKHATTVNDESAVINTILHEIAHALVGPKGHGNEWKSMAKGIGCNGQRCSRIAVAADPKYNLKCICCGYSWAYYRKPIRVDSKWHRTCGREKGRLTLECK